MKSRYYTEAVRLWRLSPDNLNLDITHQIREGEIEPIAEALEVTARQAFEAGGTVLRGGDHKWYTFEEWQKEQAAPRP